MFNADYSRASVQGKSLRFMLAVGLCPSRQERPWRQMNRKGKYDCGGLAIKMRRGN